MVNALLPSQAAHSQLNPGAYRATSRPTRYWRIAHLGPLLAWLCLTAFTGSSHAQRHLSAAGITEPILDVTLSAAVPGLIGARLVQEGDFVTAGQVVVELDKKLEELEVSRRKLLVNRLESDLEATRALFNRTKSVSLEELERKETEYRVAVVEYELAKEQLQRRLVVSPLSGIVTRLLLEVGEACQAHQPLARIVDTRRCYFISNVEAKTGHQLKVNQTVKLEIESETSTVTLEGKTVFVSPVVDPASGLLRVKVLFDNAEGKVRPGVAGRMVWEETPDGF
jgi:RND family efflux transporter MFP subunit